MGVYVKSSLGAYRLLKYLFGMSTIDSGFVVGINEDEEYGNDPVGRRRFRYLQQAGYLKRLDDDNYQLTDLAKINLLGEIAATREPDGKSRLVMFDIPQNLNQHRDMLRIQLKRMGFRMLQKSVWVSEKPCEDLVWLLIKYHGVSRYAMLMVGDVVTPKTAIAVFGKKVRRSAKNVKK